MSNKELKSLHRKLTAKIEKLSSTEGFIDSDALCVINADLTAESSSTGDYPNPNPNPNDTTESLQRLRRLDERIDECEEMFHRYNVPRVTELSSTEACESAVNQFMSVWREEAKSRRERGWKSLNERLRLAKEALIGNKLRVVEISLGKKVSFLVVTYVALIAQSSADQEEFDRKIENFLAAIDRLRVEEGEENGLIEAFLASVRNARSALLSGSVGDIFLGRVSGDPLTETESEAVHVILREVLRLEVGFNAPDMPMKVNDQVLLGMADHIFAVFDEKIARIWETMELVENELDLFFREGDFQKKDIAFKELYDGVKRVWDKLDI